MSDIHTTALEKRIQLVESLISATGKDRIRWRRVSEDTFEAIVKEKGFRLFRDENGLHLHVSQFISMGLSDWDSILIMDSGSEDSIDSVLRRLWRFIADRYDTGKVDELIDFLTGSGVLQ